MLATADLATMRDTLRASLPDSADIGRYTVSADGGGGQTVTWPVATADQDVPCRLAPASEDPRRTEVVTGDVLMVDIGWMVTLPYDVTLTEKDRLTIDETTYEVAAFFGRRSWNLGTRVLCRLVD